MQQCVFKKMNFTLQSVKWQPFSLSLIVFRNTFFTGQQVSMKSCGAFSVKRNTTVSSLTFCKCVAKLVWLRLTIAWKCLIHVIENLDQTGTLNICYRSRSTLFFTASVILIRQWKWYSYSYMPKH